MTNMEMKSTKMTISQCRELIEHSTGKMKQVAKSEKETDRSFAEGALAVYDAVSAMLDLIEYAVELDERNTFRCGGEDDE